MAKKAEDFGGMIFKVWYDPQVSQEFRRKVTLISLTMSSEHGDTIQYSIESVLDKFKDIEDTLCKEDQEFLKILKKGKIQYIEL